MSLVGIHSISLGRNGLFDIRTTTAPHGLLTTLLEKNLQAKMEKGDRQLFDVLHRLTRSSPTTKKIMAASLYPVVEAADNYMAASLSQVSNTFSGKSRYFSGSYRTSGSKRMRMAASAAETRDPGLTRSFTTRVWPKLSDDYLRRIGLAKKEVIAPEGRPKKGGERERLADRLANRLVGTYGRKRADALYAGSKKVDSKGNPLIPGNPNAAFEGERKVFWFERERAKGPFHRGGGSTGAAMYKGAEQYFYDLSLKFETGSGQAGKSAEDFGAFRKTRSISKTGRVNRFTIQAGVTRHKKPARGGRNQYGKYQIYGVQGSLLFPSALKSSKGNKLFDKTMSVSIIKSMALGREAPIIEDRASAFDRYKNSNQWRALIISNELSRPWLMKYFSMNNKNGLTKYVQEEMLAKVNKDGGKQLKLLRG